MINKNININQEKNNFRRLFCLLFLFLLFSCEDYGCIESDDFGEYEIFTFKVKANKLEEICTYKPELSDSQQAVGIQICVTGCTNASCKKECEDKCFLDKKNLETLFGASSGTVISSEPNWISIGGGGNNNLSIEQNSQIMVTAQGTVKLGNSTNKSDIRITASDFGHVKLDTIRRNTNIAEFSGGENIEINFSGAWSDSTPNKTYNSLLSGPPPNKAILKNTINYYNASIANGARRMFAYFIPFPPDYQKYSSYNFPLTPRQEAWKCNNTPDLSSVGDQKRHLRCSNNDCETPDCYDDYASLSASPYATFTSSDPKRDEYNKIFTKYFEVDNASKETSRYQGGTGFIRYKNDNLYGSDKETTDVPNVFKKTLDSTQIKAGFSFTLEFPSKDKTYLVMFRNYTPNVPNGSNCNIKFNLQTVGSSPSVTYQRLKHVNSSGNLLNYNSTNGISDDIGLGVSKFIFEPSDIANDYVVQASNAGAFHETCNLVAYFYPFHEIEFTSSGYIDFGIVKDAITTSGLSATTVTQLNNCTLKFRILNQNKEYENENFKSHGIFSTTPITNAITTTTNPTKYFIRKGQKLSFSPESWEGEWITQYNSVKKVCGVGFYVNLTPRPAVFCTSIEQREFININQDNDENNDCIPYFDPVLKKETGCAESQTSCLSFFQSDGRTLNPNFCPSECIKKDFSSCRSTEITSGNANYGTKLYSPKTNVECIPTGPEKICYNPQTIPADCTTDPTKCASYAVFANIEPYKSNIASALRLSPPITLDISRMSSTGCDSCETKMKNEAIKTYYLDANLASGGALLEQCYDIEEYKGKSSDLKSKINAITTPKLAKLLYEENEGIKKIKTFDGSYGNFYQLDYVKNANSVDIFKIENPIFISKAGYVKFIALDSFVPSALSDDFFEEIFANASPASDRGITANNFRISIKSTNELSNGAGLTVALCKESSSTGDQCSQNLSLNNLKTKFSPDLNSVLSITEFESDNSLSTSSNYKFNDFGQIIRITGSPIQGPGPEYNRECIDSEFLTPSIGKNFLCFKDISNSISSPNYDPSNGDRYRLSFKIIDNETPNCEISGPTYQECTPPAVGSLTCNKYKILNPYWNGTSDAYCSNTATSTACSGPKYQCVSDKYLNNSGHYDVAVKIKRDSKIKVSNFINSIISPVLGEIDGFSVNKKNYIAVQDVRNLINGFDFNSINPSNNKFISDTQNKSSINIANLKSNDDKIVDIAYKEEQDGRTIELNPNALNPNCRGNCFISYISSAIYGYQATPSILSINPACPSSYRLSSKATIENTCLGKSSCSFAINESEFISTSGNYSSPNAACIASDKKLMINYIYSISNQPLFKENQARRIYSSIINDAIFKNFVTLSIVLMLSFYGMGFLMGVSELKQSEIIDRLIKIGIIYLFTDPQLGWVWFEKFFVTFFKNGTDFLTFTMAAVFDESGQVDAAINANDFADKSPIFYGVDKVIGLFLVNDVIHKKIASLFFYKFFGIVYVFIIYHSAIAYVYAISNAVLIYLTSQFFTSVLFVVGPFFFVFLLFKQTRGFFDNWLNSLIGFSLQQIFLVFTLSLFNTILYFIIKLTLGFKICWDTVWSIDISISRISLLSFWTPQESPPYLGESTQPSVEGSTGGLPTLPMLLSLWTICVMMKSFISTITDLAANLSGGMSATEIGSGVSSAMNQKIGDVSKLADEAYTKSGAKSVVERADQKLFDSGRLAKQERAKLDKEDKENQNLKNQMKESGDKAVSDYKVKNHEEFSKMNEAEKTKALTLVKMNAMKETAKEMGKTDKQIRELMNDRNGRTYRGDNIFGAIKSAGLNHYNNGGRSLNEEALRVDTRMSEKEMNKALKLTEDPDKRKEFIDNVKEGKIRKKEDESSLKGFKNGAEDFIKNISQGQISKALSGAAERSFNGVANDLRQERKEAIKQLEDSGQIQKQSYNLGADGGGGNMGKLGRAAESIRYGLSTRSKGDEAKILNKMHENRLAKATEKGPNVNQKDIAKLESFNKKLSEKEGEKPSTSENKNGNTSDMVGGENSGKPTESSTDTTII